MIKKGGPLADALKAQLARWLAASRAQDRIPPIDERPPVSPTVSGLQVFDVETWWDSAGPRGLFPSIRFGIRNVGQTPVGDLAVRVYFYKPSGMPFGKSEGDIISRKAPVLPQGYWVKVDLNDLWFGSRRYESDVPEKLQAEIFASIGDCPELLLARLDFGERPHRLETHAGPSVHVISAALGISKPFPAYEETGSPSFYVSRDQLELVNIRASWALDRDSPPNEKPVVAFDVRNIKASPISMVYLIAAFATLDGEVIGGCGFDFNDSGEPPLRPSASKPAIVPCDPYSPANNPGPTPLIAEIYLKTDLLNAVLLRSIDIPAR